VTEKIVVKTRMIAIRCVKLGRIDSVDLSTRTNTYIARSNYLKILVNERVKSFKKLAPEIISEESIQWSRDWIVYGYIY